MPGNIRQPALVPRACEETARGVPPSVVRDVRAAELQQICPAEPSIGKTVRFSAWLRMMNQSGGGYVHIRMRVYYANGQSDLRDSVDPPVTMPPWQRREVSTEVKKDAESTAIWARYVPSGSAWIASPAFETVEEKVPIPVGLRVTGVIRRLLRADAF